MSDCRHGGRDAYERPYELPNGSVVFLEEDEVPAFVSIVFADEDELTRDFPLLLGGREISHVEIDGVRYERREECERVPFDAIETANERESQVTRIALLMVRDHYEHDDDAFEAACIELAEHYDKTGDVGLSEYITAQMYPQCGFIPM